MIKTAAQLMLEIGDEEPDRRPYPENRRSRNLPVMPCQNHYRGCTGRTKEKNSGRGLCRNCYTRWQRHGDSWYHTEQMQYCRRPDCFMKGTEGHP